MNRHKSIQGLPRDLLFQNLPKIPASRVPVAFLAENAWWWRRPDVKKELWIEDQLERWPDCESFSFLNERLPAKSRKLLSRDTAEPFLHQWFANLKPEAQAIIDKWWDQEILGAKAYEWKARESGAYPCGCCYIALSPAERSSWRNEHWKLNLNSVPIIETTGGVGDCPGAWTEAFRFNFDHGDGHIIREFRKRLSDERRRLQVPNPKHEGMNRRQLELSWAEIETIDTRDYSKDVGTTHAGRQRVYDARKRRRDGGKK